MSRLARPAREREREAPGTRTLELFSRSQDIYPSLSWRSLEMQRSRDTDIWSRRERERERERERARDMQSWLFEGEGTRELCPPALTDERERADLRRGSDAHVPKIRDAYLKIRCA
eukprot:1198184-Rhodomonas_salina.1